MRKRDSRFGHPDKFHRLLRRDRKLQRFRVSKANVFACENHNSPRDETEIFPGMQHFCQPVHRTFFIRSAHAFDERADGVVVRVADAIVNDGLLLDAFLGNCEREVNYRRERPRLPILPDATEDGRATFGGVVSTPISSAFRHLRASPSLNFARCRRASLSIFTL